MLHVLLGEIVGPDVGHCLLIVPHVEQGGIRKVVYVQERLPQALMWVFACIVGFGESTDFLCGHTTPPPGRRYRRTRAPGR